MGLRLATCDVRRVLPHRGKNKRQFLHSASRERKLPESKGKKQVLVLSQLRELTLAARRMKTGVRHAR